MATIARLMASVGHVGRSPRKRPKSSYILFARSTAMALWQLDAFEFRTGDQKAATVYQLLDDATRYGGGSWAYHQQENSRDAQDVLARAIEAHGAPQEVLSDNSLAFNQLRHESIGSVEIFLASKGTMPISGLPGKPTTQDKNERSHQTLQRFLEANKPHNLAELQNRLKHYREHYNRRRPHQSLHQSTPQMAWEMLEHTPAIEPLPLAVLEAKASEYRQVRKLRQVGLGKANITVSKTGEILDADILGELCPELAPTQMIIEVMREQRRIFYQGNHISVPTTFAGRHFYRTVTDDEFLLSDPDTAEVVLSFPLPLMTLHACGKFIASYSIRGIVLKNLTKQWERKATEYREQFTLREAQAPDVFNRS